MGSDSPEQHEYNVFPMTIMPCSKNRPRHTGRWKFAARFGQVNLGNGALQGNFEISNTMLTPDINDFYSKQGGAGGAVEQLTHEAS